MSSNINEGIKVVLFFLYEKVLHTHTNTHTHTHTNKKHKPLISNFHSDILYAQKAQKA